MTRTARATRLNNHLAEPFVQVHPADAVSHGLSDHALAWVTSRWGRMLGRVWVDPDQRPGSVFVPMHWSDAQSRRARADAVVNPALDPVSGQPEFKHTPVRLDAFRAGFGRGQPGGAPITCVQPPRHPARRLHPVLCGRRPGAYRGRDLSGFPRVARAVCPRSPPNVMPVRKPCAMLASPCEGASREETAEAAKTGNAWGPREFAPGKRRPGRSRGGVRSRPSF